MFTFLSSWYDWTTVEKDVIPQTIHPNCPSIPFYIPHHPTKTLRSPTPHHFTQPSLTHLSMPTHTPTHHPSQPYTSNPHLHPPYTKPIQPQHHPANPYKHHHNPLPCPHLTTRSLDLKLCSSTHPHSTPPTLPFKLWSFSPTWPCQPHAKPTRANPMHIPNQPTPLHPIPPIHVNLQPTPLPHHTTNATHQTHPIQCPHPSSTHPIQSHATPPRIQKQYCLVRLINHIYVIIKTFKRLMQLVQN